MAQNAFLESGVILHRQDEKPVTRDLSTSHRMLSHLRIRILPPNDTPQMVITRSLIVRVMSNNLHGTSVYCAVPSRALTESVDSQQDPTGAKGQS